MQKSYRYDYPHPAVTVDVAVFTVRDGDLQVLLIERGGEPYLGAWALPGGFVGIEENLPDAAARELAEEAGIVDAPLFQVATFGEPNRDPRERVITIAHTCLVGADEFSPKAGTDAAAVRWFPMGDLPPLAFDHEAILAACHSAICERLDGDRLALRLLGPVFTLPELQTVHEAVTGTSLDRRNFRKRILATWPLRVSNEPQKASHGRPPTRYKL